MSAPLRNLSALRSLSGLLDFECAARWSSFKLAAQELHKTPAAVSQQIRQLEEELGFALFIRHPRQVSVTDKGRELAFTVSRMLRDLQAKVEALQGGGEENTLRISSTHSFAIKWLVPRMPGFTRLYPELDLRIDSSDSLANLEDDSTDVAIRHGPIDDGDPALLFREQLVAVYSPALLAPGRGELTLADLAHLPLLYEQSTEAWLRFLNVNRVAAAGHDFSRRFSHSGVLAQSAVAGQGVALSGYAVVYEDILQGRLKLIAANSLPHGGGYRFLVNPGKRGMPKIERFRAWMVDEMAQMRVALEGGASA
ncbi:LysR substrate-binding domain-containing protein [Janthinobacterium agaricidamnosum]|nr:LysR substrate-binding domain-containing protein [Janthinobacterium agaricidamnosum]